MDDFIFASADLKLFGGGGQYVTDVRAVQKLLQDVEEAITVINKGEAFYKWDQTHYPEVEVIKEIIEPYQKVFGLVLQWQRTENRSDLSLMHVTI